MDEKKFCQKCGQQIPIEARFCPNCGEAQSSNVTERTQVENNQPVFEYCEIVIETKIGLIFMQGRFWAKVIGPKGIYAAAKEEKWHNGLPNDYGPRKGYQEACDRMIMQLQNDGWELLPYDRPNYWSYKFRRLVR